VVSETIESENGTHTVYSLPFTSEMRKDIRETGLPLYSGARGQYTPGSNILALTERADPSTFMHEMAHWYLHQVQVLASMDDAWATGELATITEWYEGIKTGDYVSVGIDCRVNVAADAKKKSGLYINPKAVELVGYGTQIVSQGQADPNALFGGRQHTLPPGASATPIGGGGAVGMPGMGQPAPMQQPGMMPAPAPMQQPGYPQPQMAPQPMQQPQMAPQPVQQPQMGPQPMQQPQMMPAPAHDFVQGAPGGMPMQMPGMMPPR
jgi:hypothetical protein